MRLARPKRDSAEDVGGEPVLSLLILGGLLPGGRGELEDAALRPAREEAEEIAQIAPRLDRVQPAAREQRDKDRVGFARFVAAEERPVPATYDFPAQTPFTPVVVGRQSRVVEKTAECRALIARVAD